MNTNKEIHLEPIPGINLGNEEEKKEETKVNQNEPAHSETSKIPQGTVSSQGKKDSTPQIDKETQIKLNNLRDKMLKGNRRNSTYNIPPSVEFLKNIVLVDDIDIIKEEADSFHQKIKKTYDESTDLDNTKKLFGYNSKAEKNPVKEGLLNRIDQLQRNQREINMQFEYDSDIYKKKIQSLEKLCQASTDEAKLKRLEKKNKENKDIIREYKKSIELAEKEKIKDNETFKKALDGIIVLKSMLMAELKELEILAKKTSFQDYDEYMKENPTKIEKLNFRKDDSRYLLTNEYETSREDEESFSSYDKLNHINNTPEGFDINKKNNSLSKTEQFFYNTKNFVGSVGSGNNGNNANNSFVNNKINNSYIVNNKNNKEVDKYSLRKMETLNDPKNRKSLNDMNVRSTTKKMSSKLSNFSINNKKNNINLRSKPQENNNNNNNNQGKRINPGDFIPQDPEFLDKDRVIIPDIRKGDSFY